MSVEARIGSHEWTPGTLGKRQIDCIVKGAAVARRQRVGGHQQRGIAERGYGKAKELRNRVLPLLKRQPSRPAPSGDSDRICDLIANVLRGQQVYLPVGETLQQQEGLDRKSVV